MTLENFNLQITTPEDDDNTDPEFIRLRGELMALKQPLLDAIANKDLPNAEELHKQALEAKAKLEAYKESLNKKEQYPTVEINGTKIELGPVIGEMAWDEIPLKLEEFNKTLKPGEELWRVPTKEEYQEIGAPIRNTWIDNTLTDKEKNTIVQSELRSLGFSDSGFFWSRTPSPFGSEFSYQFLAIEGSVGYLDKNHKASVRVVR